MVKEKKEGNQNKSSLLIKKLFTTKKVTISDYNHEEEELVLGIWSDIFSNDHISLDITKEDIGETDWNRIQELLDKKREYERLLEDMKGRD